MTDGPRPAVIIVSGPPAAGKSSLGAALAQRLKAALVDQDVATEALTDVIASRVGIDDLDDPRLAALTRQARYETIIRLAESNVRLGVAVVLVAPFSRERRHLAAWQDLERRLTAVGGAPLLVWLHLQPHQIVRRMRARAARRDVAKLADDATWLAGIDLQPPVGPHLSLDAARPLAELVELVLGHTGA